MIYGDIFSVDGRAGRAGQGEPAADPSFDAGGVLLILFAGVGVVDGCNGMAGVPVLQSVLV